MGCIQAEGLGDAEQSRGITEGCGATVESGGMPGLAAGLDECAQHLHRGGMDTAIWLASSVRSPA